MKLCDYIKIPVYSMVKSMELVQISNLKETHGNYADFNLGGAQLQIDSGWLTT